MAIPFAMSYSRFYSTNGHEVGKNGRLLAKFSRMLGCGYTGPLYPLMAIESAKTVALGSQENFIMKI
jgi:hypothetical protein